MTVTKYFTEIQFEKIYSFNILHILDQNANCLPQFNQRSNKLNVTYIYMEWNVDEMYYI